MTSARGPVKKPMKHDRIIAAIAMIVFIGYMVGICIVYAKSETLGKAKEIEREKLHKQEMLGREEKNMDCIFFLIGHDLFELFQIQRSPAQMAVFELLREDLAAWDSLSWNSKSGNSGLTSENIQKCLASTKNHLTDLYEATPSETKFSQLAHAFLHKYRLTCSDVKSYIRYLDRTMNEKS